jgi:hypothetical protein
MNSAKGNVLIFQGTAKDLQGAVRAAEKQISKLLRERSERPVAHSTA